MALLSARPSRRRGNFYQYSVSARLYSAAISAWLTASHPNSEVKQVRAGVVLRWGTTREGPVLRFLKPFFFFFFFAWSPLFLAWPFFVLAKCGVRHPWMERAALGFSR